MSREFDIRRAEPADLERGMQLLAAAGLPTADLTIDRLALVAIVDENLAGMIGLETFGSLGLLRSLVVSPECRRHGLGDQLVAALEDHARALGIIELWLLTLDAGPYFERLGYTGKPRSCAPADIVASDEFSSLCPDDALLMRKALAI